MRRLIVKPAALAEARGALRTSRANFGSAAARAYERLIRRAYRLLCTDARRPGVQQHEGMLEGVFLFHLRHARTRGAAPRQPRHFIVFTYDDDTLTILRVLHDSMNIEQRSAHEKEEG
ncbi:MAG: type II toxin-antitoxin system RelE/ParE family toxin [Hyphomonadaceae bacterium]